MSKSMKLSTALLVHQSLGSAVAKKLMPGQVDTMRHGKGRHLYCTSGRLWVTLEHRLGDYILEADQSLDIDENGRSASPLRSLSLSRRARIAVSSRSMRAFWATTIALMSARAAS